MGLVLILFLKAGFLLGYHLVLFALPLFKRGDRILVVSDPRNVIIPRISILIIKQVELGFQRVLKVGPFRCGRKWLLSKSILSTDEFKLIRA